MLPGPKIAESKKIPSSLLCFPLSFLGPHDLLILDIEVEVENTKKGYDYT